MEKSYTVHKMTVQTFRKALITYMFSEDRACDIPNITSNFSNVDDHKGERIPLTIVDREFNIAVSFFQDEHIGLKVIEHIDIEPIILYQGIKNFLTPFWEKEIEVPFFILCQLISRYSMLMTEALVIEVIEVEGFICLEFKPRLKSTSKHHIDSIILTIHKIINHFTRINPIKLQTSYRIGEQSLLVYKRYFTVQAELSTGKNCLYYRPLTDLKNYISSEITNDFKVVLSNGFSITHLHNMLIKEFSGKTYTDQCYHILITIIGIMEPTREQVARILNMSVSSLQRRLRKEGITFQEILLNTRKLLAHKYLVEQELTATHVAFLLGYQSSSQFFTAFKNWFSMTPRSYKELYL